MSERDQGEAAGIVGGARRGIPGAIPLAAGLGLALGLGLSGCLGGISTCNGDFDEVDVETTSVSPSVTSLAVRLRAPAGNDDTFLSTEVMATNNAEGVQASVALYRFTDAPAKDALPALVVGEDPPATLPGGGTLVEVRDLGATIARQASLRDELEPDAGAATDAWYVVLVSADADVSLRLVSFLVVCKEGRLSPSLPGDFFAQIF